MLQAVENLLIAVFTPMPQWHGTYTSKYSEIYTDANIKEVWGLKPVPMKTLNNHHLSIIKPAEMYFIELITYCAC